MRTGRHRSFWPLRAALWGGLVCLLGGCHAVNGHLMNASGAAYYQRGNYWMARQEFHRAVLDDPENASYVHNLATATKHSGDKLAAERIYRHAINIDPSHQPSYHGLAMLLNEQGRQAEARHLLETWAGSQPYRVEPHIELAWHQQELGEWAEAERSLRTALSIQPNHAIAAAHLGQVYQRAGRPAQALAMYQRSLAANANQPQVRARVASLAPAVPPAMPMMVQHPQMHMAASPVGRYTDSLAMDGDQFWAGRFSGGPVVAGPWMGGPAMGGPAVMGGATAMGRPLPHPLPAGQPIQTVSHPMVTHPLGQPLPQPVHAQPQFQPVHGLMPNSMPMPAPQPGGPMLLIPQPDPIGSSAYNADPAHVPQWRATAELPVVRPY